jgi:TolB-like protein
MKKQLRCCLNRMDITKKYIITGIFCILITVTGCRSIGPSWFYVRQDTDFSFIKRVAVLPMENLSNDKFAADIVSDLVVSELLASGLVDVVIPGDVTAALNKLDIKSISSPSAEQIKALGKALRVEAVITGTIEQYGETTFGNVSSPEVTISFMMTDVGSGSIIWSVTKTRGGLSFMAKHFGARSETLSETVLAVVREAILTLTRQ